MIETDGWETVYQSRPIWLRHGETCDDQSFGPMEFVMAHMGVVCSSGMQPCRKGCFMFDSDNKGHRKT